MNYRLESLGHEKIAVVLQPLDQKSIEELRGLNVNTVEVVDGKGWKGGSIDFVSRMDFVEHFCVRTMLAPANDISAIENMPQLKTLELATGNTKRCQEPFLNFWQQLFNFLVSFWLFSDDQGLRGAEMQRRLSINPIEILKQ